jgi:HNH endonuclease
MITLPERILSKLEADPDTGCLLWLGSVGRGGYGCVGVGGHIRKIHRVVWASANGSIPAGLTIGHACHDVAAERGECSGGDSCRHRRCANPEHLHLESQRENTLASPLTLAGRNARATHCRMGHLLTTDRVPPSFVAKGWRWCLVCRREASIAGSSRRNAETAAIRRAIRVSHDEWRSLPPSVREETRRAYRAGASGAGRNG